MIESNLTTAVQIDALLVISDERVLEMLQTITPLVQKRDDGNTLHEIELPADLRNTAFRWDPVYTNKVDMARMHVLNTVTTYHTCAYHGCFKPDIVEVLAQIDQLPDEIKLQVIAFDVLSEQVDILTGSFYGHKTKTVLYRAADDCSICDGANGGVAGNGNIIDSKVVCDYCSCGTPVRIRTTQ